MDDFNINNERQSNALIRKVCLCFLAANMAGWLNMTLRFWGTDYYRHYMIYNCFNFIFLLSGVCLEMKSSDRWFCWKKYILMISFLGGIFLTSYMYAYYIQLLYTVPLILSSRYYDRKFQKHIAFLTAGVVVMSWTINACCGMSLDLNYITLPIGTVLTITDGWIETEVLCTKLSITGLWKDYLVGAIIPMLSLIWASHIALDGITRNGAHMIEEGKKIARYDQELSIAADIQLSMLPGDFHSYRGHEYAEITAKYYTAKEVGGDLYQYFALDEHRICLIIGDVSGKGVPAALFMVKCLTCLKDFINIGLSPAEAMTKANQTICESNKDDYFATMWVGIVDTRTGEVEYVSGGHNLPLLCRMDGSCTYLKGRSNFLVGLMPGMKYRSDHLKLEIGEKLFLYTDGVTECMNVSSELYGEERLQAFFEHRPEISDQELLDLLQKDLSDFAGEEPQSDDITMLILTMKDYAPASFS